MVKNMLKLSVKTAKGTVAEASGEQRVHLVYAPAYRKGDVILLETDQPGFLAVRLEDTLPETIVRISGTTAEFPIPFGVNRAGFSPRSFLGKRHFIEARTVSEEEVKGFRNLAYNPHDQSANRNIYPHMTSNVEYADTLRNKIFPDRGLFAPRNVIDGILANESHRLYPHQSWGINRNPDAWLTCDFGRPVDTEMMRLAIRGEFPHDNWWVKGTVRCSDGSEETFTLEKTLEFQEIPLVRKRITSVTLCNLVMSDDPSPFPALSLLEIWGTESGQ